MGYIECSILGGVLKNFIITTIIMSNSCKHGGLKSCEHGGLNSCEHGSLNSCEHGGLNSCEHGGLNYYYILSDNILINL